MEDIRNNVLGVGISPLNLSTACQAVIDRAKVSGSLSYVTVTGVHGVMESQKSDVLKKIHNKSFLSVPDGMPMVWLAKWGGFQKVSRVYGPDLMLETFKEGVEAEIKHYLFGGGDGVAELLNEKLNEKYSDAKIVGTMTPPFRPLNEEEEKSFIEEIEKLRPHFIWVGLSTPKQEVFMNMLASKYPDLTKNWEHGLVMLGVGAAFDFHAGLVKQAPKWIQSSGFEWLFRLVMEPRRLWRRYLENNTKFICQIIPQMMGVKKMPVIK